MAGTITRLAVADPPESWADAGFRVEADGTCRTGTVTVELVGRERGKGIVGWSLDGMTPSDSGELDGIPTSAGASAEITTTAPHPNGVTTIDHVVLLSPDLQRTIAALRGIGLEPRRERDGELGGAPMRQVFYRLGEVILEVVGSPDAANEGPSTLWGLTLVVADVDAAAARLGEAGGRPKDAVQPGRRITTLRHRDLGLSVRTALITPHPRGA